jgi:hypothetical protein
MAFLALALGALTAWPPWILTPAHELDPSWQVALHLARHARLAWGREVLFPYGPLAFIDWPNVITYPSLILGLLYGSLCVGLILLVPLAGLREYPVRVAVGVSIAFCLVAPTEIFVAEIVSVEAFAVALLVLSRPDAWRLDIVAGCLGALLAVQLLIKPSTAAIVGVALVVVILAGAPAKLRRALVGILASAGGVLALWLLLGQSPADFPRWVRGVLELSLGYTDAMAAEGSGQRLTYLAALVLTAMLGWFIWSSAAFSHRRDGWIFVASTVVVAWISLKEGFVRADVHSTIFFFSLALVAAVVPRRPGRLVPLLAVVLTGLLLTGVVARLPATASVDSGRSFITLVRAITSASERDRLREAGLYDVRSMGALAPNVLVDLKGRTVHVDPIETSVVWGFGLDWRPVPVFQRYSAYNAYLDELNAAALRGADAPERILRDKATSIDGRNAMWDSPRYMLELACRYRQGPSDTRWGSFAAGPSRCGSERVLARARFSAGEPVHMPVPPDPHSIVLARFSFAVPAAERLVQMLTRPIHHTFITADGERFRISDPSSGGPLLVRTRGALGWQARYGGDVAYDVLVPSRGGSVVFSTVPIASDGSTTGP